MTVVSQESTVVHNGNGVTQVFPIPFRFFKNTDLFVYTYDTATNISTPLVLNVDYTLTGEGNPTADGDLTTVVAYPTGIQIAVIRDMPVQQLTDIVNQGPFFPEIHENVFDRLTMMIQEIGNSGGNAIRIPVSEQGFNTITPASAVRADKVLAFDNLGNVIVSDLTLAQIEASSTISGTGRGTQNIEATAGQTVLTTDFAYVPNVNQISISVNGLLLTPAEDYTETSGTTVTLNNPLDAGDIVVIEAYSGTTYSVDSSNVAFAGGTLDDLTNTTDPSNGAALVGRAVVVVDSLKDLLGSPLAGRTDIVIQVQRYWGGTNAASGGGWFQWLASLKSNHDGGVRISPTVPWDGTQGNHENFLNGVGETDPSGSGYWLRVSSAGTQGRSPLDYGAQGVSIVPDSKYIFDKFETKFPASESNLNALQFRVSVFPSGAKYYNGSFRRISDDLIVDAGWSSVQRIGNKNVLLGRETANNLTTLNHEETGGRGYNLTAVGDKALYSAGNDIKHCTAIGPSAGYSQQYGRYNIYIGLEAGYSCTGDSADDDIGSRNVAVGDNAMRFNQGYQNNAMGRNSLQVNVNGNYNTAIGSAACTGTGPVGLDGVTIQNPFPTNGGYKTAVGAITMTWAYADYIVGVGSQALETLKGGIQNVAVGGRALRLLESNYGPQGNLIRTSGAGAKTWTRSGTTLTVNSTGHANVAGDVVALTFTSGVPANVIGVTQYLTVAANTTNSFTVTLTSAEAAAMSASGNATEVEAYYGAVQATQDNNTALGHAAGNALVTGSENTLIGQATAFSMTSGVQNTAVGRSALRYLQSGASATTFNNCTGVGYDTRISGNNQVQLGNSLTTTYVYGTVQNRSDARDKIDVVDTDLGLDFVLGLRPVSGRWDMREDYVETAEDGEVTRYEKDGSRARTRKHQWFIAQEVQALCERLGVEFGGLQHHAHSGGEDVFSLGYDEFIPPLVKSVQDCWEKLESIEGRLSALEAANVAT